MTAVKFTPISRNGKTGPIPVSMSPVSTCPITCPLRDNGCYADGYPLKGHWQRMHGAVAWTAFTATVAALPQGQLWRHNQAGDLPHVGQVIDAAAVDSLVSANSGRMGFTYTHHDMAISGNGDVVRDANRAGFTVNLSANNLAHVDDLAALKIGPVVTMLPLAYQRRERTVNKVHEWLETAAEYRDRMAALPHMTDGGSRVVVCPATYRDDVTCSSCKLCARADRDVIVGFPAHGSAKRKASEVAA